MEENLYFPQLEQINTIKTYFTYPCKKNFAKTVNGKINRKSGQSVLGQACVSVSSSAKTKGKKTKIIEGERKAD